jgi:hypothetical protein
MESVASIRKGWSRGHIRKGAYDARRKIEVAVYMLVDEYDDGC